MNALQMKLTKVSPLGGERQFSHDGFQPFDAATCVVQSFNVVLEGCFVPHIEMHSLGTLLLLSTSSPHIRSTKLQG